MWRCRFSPPSTSTLSPARKANDRFIEGSKAQNRSRVKPGSLFLSQKPEGDWSHVAIVVSPSGATFTSIGGNTNDEGSVEGFEVCSRTRDWASKDVIRI
jgi:hypothetical protein